MGTEVAKSVKIGTIQNTTLQKAAQIADSDVKGAGQNNGILDSSELSLFITSAVKKSADSDISANVDEIFAIVDEVGIDEKDKDLTKNLEKLKQLKKAATEYEQLQKKLEEENKKASQIIKKGTDSAIKTTGICFALMVVGGLVGAIVARPFAKKIQDPFAIITISGTVFGFGGLIANSSNTDCKEYSECNRRISSIEKEISEQYDKIMDIKRNFADEN